MSEADHGAVTVPARMGWSHWTAAYWRHASMSAGSRQGKSPWISFSGTRDGGHFEHVLHADARAHAARLSPDASLHRRTEQIELIRQLEETVRTGAFCLFWECRIFVPAAQGDHRLAIFLLKLRDEFYCLGNS